MFWAAAIPAIAGLIGAHANRQSQEAANNKNEEMQRDFARNSIRWKMEDARAAGVHPVYALGAQGYTASPSHVGDTSMGQALANVGQDVSRSMHATRTQGERDQAFSTAIQRAQLENSQLQNELLRSQIAKMNQTGPPMPSPMDAPGISGQHPGISFRPAEITASRPGVPAQEAGAVNDYGLVRTSSGLAIVPSKDAKERIEDQLVPETMWALRNTHIFSHPTPPDPQTYKLPKGYDEWRWNPFVQEFRPARKGEYHFKRSTPSSINRRDY